MVTYFRNGKENSAALTMKNVAGNTSVVTKGMGIDEIFGARLETLSSSEKRMYNIDHGVKIVDISDGKFKDWGLKKGTIIMSVNGKKVDNSDDVRKMTNNENSLRTIEGYQPDGTHFNVQYGN
jgi:S1-C subfamily serine protease